MNQDKFFLREAIKESKNSRKNGGEPFGAILVKDNKIVGRSGDFCVKESNPTRHAELSLISDYCEKNNKFDLEDYVLYSSAEPCIMCSGAIHWSKISKVVFGISQETLKKSSMGNKKPTCKELLSYGGQKREVIGPLLEQEALKEIEGFEFNSKIERHKKIFQKG